MRGILLAGGTGSRLFPITISQNKQLLPIYDKPMFYYPLATLMLAGIREITLISSPDHINKFEILLGDGTDLGLSLNYRIQEKPAGIGQAFELVGEEYFEEPVALILGDNIFYGPTLGGQLAQYQDVGKATIFAYRVANPERYGVVELDENSKPISVIEKPDFPKSNLAITGLYFFPKDIFEISKNQEKSKRGEFEITNLLERYRKEDRLEVKVLPRGSAWLDTGTFNGIHEASAFVRTLENRQGIKIACLEEIAFYNGWITRLDLYNLALKYHNSEYGEYINNIANSNA